MGEIAPATLHNVGAALHDRTWVDMGLCNGTELQRVRVVALIVRRDSDEVVIEQLAPLPDSIQRNEHTFDAEDVAWLRPTQVSPLDVRPILQPVPEPTIPVDATYEARVLAHVLDVISARTGAPGVEILAGDNYARPSLYERQEAMWCLFEMTNLSTVTICTRYFGYKSPQPMLTCRYRVEDGLSVGTYSGIAPSETGRNFVKFCRDTIHKADESLGATHRRASDQFGPCPTVRP